MVSIAHWLDTFTCIRYAECFERSGLQNLQSVCQLTVNRLQMLGVRPNDISTIMENVSLLKQSLKSLESPRYLDLNSEPPPSMSRSRTTSPAVNTLSRNLSQNPVAYSPGPNVSTPPTSSGPSPDRVLSGAPPPFDTMSPYHRQNSYPAPVNPNTFLDISPSSSASSPHRSASMDAYPPAMEPGPYNDYQPPPQMQPLPQHAYQPPGMMYRGNPNQPPGVYYNPAPPRFYSHDPQQQQPPSQFMYPNQRMMMHPPAQAMPWPNHRPTGPSGPPPPPPSHQMHYHGYEHSQYRMPNAPQYPHPNHPMMSDQSSMFINQQPPPMNPSTSNRMPNTGESHPHPLQSLERLVLLPESQVIDPKSVVNEIHDPQSPFSESLSPYGTSSPKNSVATPPTATIVSNLLTNEKSMLEQHGKVASGMKRSSTHDERTDLNKKNRHSSSNEVNTGDSIINNHPVVTSLLTRGLNNTGSPALLPSIKSLQQKHNTSFMQQQPSQQQHMIYGQNQPDPQQCVDGLMPFVDDVDNSKFFEQNYEDILERLRIRVEETYKFKQRKSLNNSKFPSQFDGLSEATNVIPNDSHGASKKRRRSNSSEQTALDSDHHSDSRTKEKSNSDPVVSSLNGKSKRRAVSSDHQTESVNDPVSDSNADSNSSSSNSDNGNTLKIRKPRSNRSRILSDNEHDKASSEDSTSHPTTDNHTTVKPIREAKKRSLIYTGNTREFLETAIAAGLIDAIGDEDEDNEYVPPGGRINIRSRPSRSSSDGEEQESGSDTNAEDEETNSSTADDDEEEEDEDDEEVGAENLEPTTTINPEEPSESGICWNVRNRPQRETHKIRFDQISKEDEQRFFGALQEQAPQLAAYLNEESDEDFKIGADENQESSPAKPRKRSTIRKSQTKTRKESSEHDEETVEILKKFRHVNVSTEKKAGKSSKSRASTNDRADGLYVVLDADCRKIVSGSQLETSKSTKKSSPIRSFHFPHRSVKLNTVEDNKAPWRCILCWKEPYEAYLGPLFGSYALNEQCQTYLKTKKSLAKHYRKLKEVWFHRDCALWNNHIQMHPNTGDLLNVSDACSTYLDITCSLCQIPGATLACRYRNCKIRYHYPCAKTTPHCRLILQSYSIYCPKHNQMNKNKSRKPSKQPTPVPNNLNESSINA